MKTDTQSDAIHHLGSSGQRVAYRHITPPMTAHAQSDVSTPHILFCSGFYSTMNGTKASALGAFCQRQGWSYTCFDYRGLGESDGQAPDYTLDDWLADMLAILDHINKPTILIGSSMGAWLATVAAMHRNASIKGLLLLAAAPDFLQELVIPRLGKAELWDISQGKVLTLPSHYGESYSFTQALLDSGKRLSLLNNDTLVTTDSPPTNNPFSDSKPLSTNDGIISSHTIHCPVRLIHGTGDTDVPPSFSERLMATLVNDDAELRLLHRADHRLSDDRSLRCIEHTLASLVQLAY